VTGGEDFELERLRSGDPTIGGHRGFLVAFVVHCDQPARVILDRVIAIMCLLLEKSQDDWPINQAWRRILPSEFMSWFEPELSGEEREKERQRILSLSYDERRRLADRWRLSGWLYSMQPSEREWRWSIARCTDDNTIVCVCEFPDWPAGWGQLSALYLACGASTVDERVECRGDLLALLNAFSEASSDQK
jgi:hypothetical protein